MSNYQGLAVGGPYDGQKVISRNPKGFVLVDKPNNQAWIYEFWTEGVNATPDETSHTGKFVVRGEALEFDPEKGWAAAESDGWDVIALDPEVAGGN